MGESLDSLDGFSSLTALMMNSYLLMTAAQVSKPEPLSSSSDLKNYPELNNLVAKRLPECSLVGRLNE